MKKGICTNLSITQIMQRQVGKIDTPPGLTRVPNRVHLILEEIWSISYKIERVMRQGYSYDIDLLLLVLLCSSAANKSLEDFA